MRHLTSLLITLTLWGGLYVGLSQEPEDPHEGQPASCTNMKSPLLPDAPLCKCRENWNKEDRCDRDALEDTKCQVFCRKDKCFCDHGCESN